MRSCMDQHFLMNTAGYRRADNKAPRVCMLLPKAYNCASIGRQDADAPVVPADPQSLVGNEHESTFEANRELQTPNNTRNLNTKISNFNRK